MGTQHCLAFLPLLYLISAGSWNHLKAHLFTNLAEDAEKTGLLQNMMVGLQGPTLREKSETERDREKLRPSQAKAFDDLELEDCT